MFTYIYYIMFNKIKQIESLSSYFIFNKKETIRSLVFIKFHPKIYLKKIYNKFS